MKLVNQVCRGDGEAYWRLVEPHVSPIRQGISNASAARLLISATSTSRCMTNDWSARGYYGTIAHDSKAVFHRHIGAQELRSGIRGGGRSRNGSRLCNA